MDRDEKGKFLINHKNLRPAKLTMCSVVGCERLAFSNGLCSKHYQRYKKYGTPTEPYHVLSRPKSGSTFICETCGKSFYRCPSEIKKGSYRFCSKKCGYIASKGIEKNIVPIDERTWFVSKKGYLATTIRRKWIWQHRWVLERYLGRKLLKSEIVHHLNAIKTDNRIENLALCSQKTHYHFIKKLQERICLLESLLKAVKDEK